MTGIVTKLTTLSGLACLLWYVLALRLVVASDAIALVNDDCLDLPRRLGQRHVVMAEELSRVADGRVIKKVSLVGAVVDESGWRYIATLREAETISLVDVNLEDRDLAFILAGSNCVSLNVSDTFVTGGSIPSLASASRLKHLVVSNSGFGQEDVARLKALRPDLSVQW